MVCIEKCSDMNYLAHVIYAGLVLEVSLRLMFFRAFNSLHGSVGANFSNVVLKIIIVTVSIYVNGEVHWANDIITNAYHKTQYTK